ncbi:MAG TPA: superoxide dismutase [Haloplasmataceae bacterium]
MALYTLPKLPYAYDALEPYIDAKTVEIHYSKHHAAYLNNLNKILEKYPEISENRTIEEILTNINDVPVDIRQQVINQGGGFANHNLYWSILSPNGGGVPSEKISQAIIEQFGTFDELKRQLKDAAIGVFGSGYGFLVMDKDSKKLEIMQTKNQDSPLSFNKIPLIIIDVWEHAYYLLYQNRRADYVERLFNIIDWDKIESLYNEAL